MSNSNTQSIPALKSAFLRTQIRLLSAILRPSSTWRSQAQSSTTAVPAPVPAPLPTPVVDAALTALNARLAAHNTSAYPPQTQRHIVEQIDRLYTRDVRGRGLLELGPGEVGVEIGTDLAEDDVGGLPEEWGEVLGVDSNREAGGEDAERYARLRHGLGVAVQKQRAERERLEALRRVQGLLGGFEDVAGLQGNLVGKGGELEKELARLRVLVARVVGALEGGGLEEGGAEGTGGKHHRNGERAHVEALTKLV